MLKYDTCSRFVIDMIYDLWIMTCRSCMVIFVRTLYTIGGGGGNTILKRDIQSVFERQIGVLVEEKNNLQEDLWFMDIYAPT